MQLLSCLSSLFSNSSSNQTKNSLSSIHELSIKLTKWKLLIPPNLNIQDFAQVIVEIQQQSFELNQLTIDEINEALNSFNEKFLEITIKSPIDREDSDTKEEEEENDTIDSDLLQAIKEHKSASLLERNILNAIYFVYQKMNQNRKQLGLTYHQPRHAIEMFFDAYQLISIEKDSLLSALNIHLLMPLCGLFHDAVYNNARLLDEKESAKIMQDFLAPILERLSPKHRRIIGNMINLLIIGGTTPMLFNEIPLDSQVVPMQKTVAEIIELASHQKRTYLKKISIFPEVSLTEDILQYAADTMPKLDVQRTAIPSFHTHTNNFYRTSNTLSHSWSTIEQLFSEPLEIQERKKLAQNFRVMSEMILLNPKDKATQSEGYQWAYSLYKAQSACVFEPCSVSETLILFMAEKLKSEINFADRMHYTSLSCYQPKTFTPVRYTFEKNWLKHKATLQTLHHFLIDPTVSLDKKATLITALTLVSVEQDGKNISLSTILSTCIQLKAHISSTTQRSDMTHAYSLDRSGEPIGRALSPVG